MTATLEPYDDGRWSLADHLPDPSASLWCRGNVGEVFPNVMAPLSASLYRGAMERGQADAAREWGMVTDKQYAAFADGHGWLTGVFGGYLYGNVTLARGAVARSPGLTVELVDEQMFGLSDAPPHTRTKGERDPASAVKSVRKLATTMRRPDDSQLRQDQADVAAYVSRQPSIDTASNDDLIGIARSLTPWAERMMRHLLLASSAAGISRSMLERVVASLHEPGLENRLTAGLGTVESAQPAQELWPLGRMVAASPTLSALFDEGIEALDARLRAHPQAVEFVTAFDRFVSHHGSRGPDEWELASPTWGSDPTIALAIIERLRHAPDDRDPIAVGARLGAERGVADPRDPGSVALVQAPAVRHRDAGHDGVRRAARGDEGRVRPCPRAHASGARRAGPAVVPPARRLLPAHDRRSARCDGGTRPDRGRDRRTSGAKRLPAGADSAVLVRQSIVVAGVLAAPSGTEPSRRHRAHHHGDGCVLGGGHRHGAGRASP